MVSLSNGGSGLREVSMRAASVLLIRDFSFEGHAACVGRGIGAAAGAGRAADGQTARRAAGRSVVGGEAHRALDALVLGGPAGGDGLLAGVEADALGAVGVVLAEQRVLPAAEGVVAHRRGDRDVDADHADGDLV